MLFRSSADIQNFLKDADEIRQQIEKIEKDNDLRKKVQDAMNGLKAVVQPAAKPDAVSDEPHKVYAEPRSYRFGKLKAFKNEADAFKSAVWMKAAIFGDRNAQVKAMNLGLDIRNSMSEGVNTAGGAIVPDEMAQTIIDLRETYGVFRRNTRVVPMGQIGRAHV